MPPVHLLKADMLMITPGCSIVHKILTLPQSCDGLLLNGKQSAGKIKFRSIVLDLRYEERRRTNSLVSIGEIFVSV